MKDAKAMHRILAVSVILIMICVGVSYMTVSLMTHREEWAHDRPGGHQWLHKKLGLTPEEAGAIDQYEDAYRTEPQPVVRWNDGLVHWVKASYIEVINASR